MQIMNTFKTAVVLATLLGVGYGMHVVLNKPADSGADNGWGDSSSEPLASLNLNAFKKVGSSKQPDEQLTPPQVEIPTNVAVATPSAEPTLTPSLSAPTELAASSAVANPPPVQEMPSSMAPSAGTSLASTVPLSHNTPMTTMTPVGPTPPATAVYPAETGGTASMIQTVSASSSSEQATPAGQASTPSAPGQLPGMLKRDPFEEAWQLAESQVQAQQFVEALMGLSLTLSTDQLNDEQRARSISLLDQLAGTVIYSKQHSLSAPYTVQPGDTWDSIALKVSLTPEFLSRVNQLSAIDPLQPGQTIKVVQGPFRAELSLARRELTLYLGRLYAGRFEVAIGRDLPQQVSQLDVASKDGPRPYYDRQTGQVVQAGAPENPYGNHWISLRDGSASGDQGLGIHSTGSRVQASDTRGCISVSEEDADDLKAILVVGSKISVVR
jgi:LysM repeat protein